MAFSEIRTQRRITVREASGGDLFKGAVAIAAGTTLISCLTLDISTGLKGALLVVGCLLCLYGAKWVRKYLKDDKTYREYAPEWDDKHFIYDRFAKGLNAWYRQEELPEDADGDIAYFLKLPPFLLLTVSKFYQLYLLINRLFHQFAFCSLLLKHIPYMELSIFLYDNLNMVYLYI